MPSLDRALASSGTDDSQCSLKAFYHLQVLLLFPLKCTYSYFEKVKKTNIMSCHIGLMLYAEFSVLIRGNGTTELTDPYVLKGIACIPRS